MKKPRIITSVDSESGMQFDGVEGDIHQWVEAKLEELGIELAAVRVYPIDECILRNRVPGLV